MDRLAKSEGLDCTAGNVFSEDTNAVRLWCLGTEDILFDQLASYGTQTFGDFLSILTIVCICLYFVTSSDSGSLVIDIIGANGIQNPPTLQRIFWAVTEGATASVLLNAGKDAPPGESGDALKALQTVSIVGGLPYTVVLFLMCQALYIVVQEECGDLVLTRKNYGSFVFMIDHKGAKDYGKGALRILEAAVFPPLPLARCCHKVWGSDFKGQWIIGTTLPFLTIIVFMCMSHGEEAMQYLAASVFFLFTALIACARYSARTKVGIIRGDFITDFCLSMLIYFLVLPQMECELEMEEAKGIGDGAGHFPELDAVAQSPDTEMLEIELVEDGVVDKNSSL